jgi:protein-tyrosine phosphatase
MRLLQLGGTRDLRDLGGYATRDGRRTRWRTAYRSDCLDRIDAEGQAWLVQSGLRTIIDVRDSVEATMYANVFASSTQIAYRQMPLWDEPPPERTEPQVADGYIRPLEHAGPRLGRIVEAVAAPAALPVLIHCAAGKDRTGIAPGRTR